LQGLGRVEECGEALWEQWRGRFELLGSCWRWIDWRVRGRGELVERAVVVVDVVAAAEELKGRQGIRGLSRET
jgi:hypothetical protein